MSGIHHVTAIAGDASRNLDFYTRVLGLRLVKKTVNYDDPGTYHFYFGDEAGHPGTILTFFPWAHAPKGRGGVGLTQQTMFRVPESAIGYWAHRFVEKGVPHEAIEKRFGQSVLAFTDPDGTSLALVGALGLWVGWPRSADAATSLAAGGAPHVTWEPWSPEAVAKLRGEGRIVYVDFTARWCATCQTNKKLVFSSDDVLRAFADQKIATLRGDWTNKDPRITTELASYGRSAVPFNVIWFPGREEPVILPELLTPGLVMDTLRAGAAASTRKPVGD